MVTDAPVISGGTLTVEGWGAFNVQGGIAADSVAIAFVAPGGAAWVAPAFQSNREGVSVYFRHPDLCHVGVRAAADISALPPEIYSVQMILHRGAEAVACPTRLRVIVLKPE